MRIILRLTLLVLVVIAFLNEIGKAQQLTSTPHRGVVEVPIGSEVYPFLRHLSVRGVIHGFSETELPISEFEVVQLLDAAEVPKLSQTETSLRNKFLRTYKHEPLHAVTVFPADSASPLFFQGIPTNEDKYLYRWARDSSKSDLYVNGIASLELRERVRPEEAKVVLGVIGGRFYGTIDGHVGYLLEATNGEDFGDSSVALEDPLLASNKNFTLFSKKDFDFTTAELTYSYDWFTAKLAREAVGIGGSYQQDNIILSANVPSYDFVSIGAHIGAVRYEAMIASLLGEPRWSLGWDTITRYQAGAFLQIDPKYLTVHDLSFTINDDFEFGFTDMVVVSRRFDLAYANPFSFLKSVEHSLLDRDNGILGVHSRWNIVDGVEVRGEGVLDDVKASEIGKGYWSNKFAWQLGGMWANALGLSDVDVMLEWTRIEPYTFTHFLPQDAFSTSATLLSNHIGPNSISYWGSLRWTASEKWALQIEGELIERGENIYDSTGELVTNYGSDFEHTVWDKGNGDIPNYILQGNRVNIVNLTGIIQFEPWRDLFVFVRGTDKLVRYANPTPYPQEHAAVLLAVGARAQF